jgi:hypothetical protein
MRGPNNAGKRSAHAPGTSRIRRAGNHALSQARLRRSSSWGRPFFWASSSLDPGRHVPSAVYIYITKSLDVYCGVLGADTFCSSTYLLAAKRPEWDNPGLPGKTVCAMDEGVVCHPDLRCVKTQRIGPRSNVCTNVSEPLRALPALGYEAAVSLREAICLSLKSHRPDFLRQCPRSSNFCHFDFSDLCVAHDGIWITFSRSAH